MKFYKVTAKCGHVGGPDKYILNDYYIQLPGKKHGRIYSVFVFAQIFCVLLPPDANGFPLRFVISGN